jgi:hypothetical protein
MHTSTHAPVVERRTLLATNSIHVHETADRLR